MLNRFRRQGLFLALAVLALLSALPVISGAAVLREDIGELKIHDLLLRPNFLLEEGRNSNFSIGESSFALRWELEQKFAGVIRIGPRTLMNPVARYSDKVNDDVTLVEAFAEYDDVYGRFRMGRIPVEFGYEGRLWERYLIFPRSLLFQNRAMMLRDVGASYEITENNWYTGLVIHNGESDNDTDGRTWYTARWGVKADNFEVGAAGQTGSTRADATKLSNDTLAGVDPTKDAKWRLYGLFGEVNRHTWEIIAEAYLGELVQEDVTSKFATGHIDFSYIWSKRFSTHLRYDFFDPNLDVDGDQQRQASVALEISNQSHSSNLILVGTKVFNEASGVHDDQIRLIWSLSPSGIVRF